MSDTNQTPATREILIAPLLRAVIAAEHYRALGTVPPWARRPR